MLTRHCDINARARRQHDGPVAGGTFWALAAANDLPLGGPIAHADPVAMLRHGRIWWQDATRPGTWQPVTSAAQVAKLQRQARASLRDDWQGCTARLEFVPEFYFAPRNWRGRRLVDRATARAHVRNF